MVGLTAGVGFETIIRQLPARAEIFGCIVDVVARCHYPDKAARSFEDAVRAGKTALREQRRAGPVLSGSAGMEGLAHRAEYLAYAAGLRARDGKRIDHLFLVELEQTAHRGCRAEHAAGVGNMPVLRAFSEVRGDHQPDTAGNLHAERE